MTSPVRPAIAKMHGYTPGEQPGARQRVVKLNTNENPYPPSPNVLAALQTIDADALRRYPDPHATAFREAAARLWGVAPEQIVCGNGSDDILAIAVRTFVPPGGLLASPAPTYSVYPTLAQIQEATYQTFAWEDGWALPTEALVASGADAIFLANPNAPSGTVTPVEQIAELAHRTAGALLVDEAYADFEGVSALALLGRHDNVVIARSLSKGYSLAGLRFGYAITSPALAAEMSKVKDSYNCDAIAVRAAVEAINDQAYATSCWAKVVDERRRLAMSLTGSGWRLTDSRANFVFAIAPDGVNAGSCYRKLRERGILVRWFDQPGLSDALRITVGTPEQNDALLEALEQLIEKGEAA